MSLKHIFGLFTQKSDSLTNLIFGIFLIYEYLVCFICCLSIVFNTFSIFISVIISIIIIVIFIVINFIIINYKKCKTDKNNFNKIKIIKLDNLIFIIKFAVILYCLLIRKTKKMDIVTVHVM